MFPVWLWGCIIGLSLFVACLLHLSKSLFHKSNRELVRMVPKLPGYPLIGNLLDFMTNKHHILDVYEKALRTYGNTVQFETLGTKFVLVNEPDQIKHIVSTKFDTVYEKGPLFLEQADDFLGKGIFAVNGEQWKVKRKEASILFHTQNLKKYISIFRKHADKLLQKMQKISTNFDIQDMFMRYTLDSFSEIGLGTIIDSISQDENQFAKAFDYVQIKTERRGRLGRFWRLTPRDKLFDQYLEVMNNLAYRIISERRAEPPEKLAENTDLLSQALIRLSEDPSKDPKEIDRELRDFVVNFLLAGRDTTATLLTWFFYLLSIHPDIQQKVIEDVDNAMLEQSEDESSEDLINWQSIKKMKYLKQALFETLRLYPPVPVDGYAAKCDDILPGNYAVEKDTIVLYCSYFLHRTEKFFPNPTEFRPERFATQPAAYTWVPFHAGPRICLGQEMAIVEAQTMAATILSKFTFKLRPNPPVQLKQGFILTALNGVWVDLCPRRK